MRRVAPNAIDEVSERCAERIGAVGVVPVIVIDEIAAAAPLAQALLAGNLPIAEVTLRTDAALESIAAMAADPALLVGAGTVLDIDQVDAAVAAGAGFIVSPGFSPTVVAYCRERGIPVFPGVATSGEVQRAYEAGLRTVKFFPAEAIGGLPALAAIAQPFGMMRFVPTGGIQAATADSYLAHPAVRAVGGSWMVARALIGQGRFGEITALSGEAVAAATRLRKVA